MYFSTKTDVENILVKHWSTHSVREVVLVCGITLLFTALFEGLKAVKTVLVHARKQNPLAKIPKDDDVSESTDLHSELLESLKIPASLEQIRFKKLMLFLAESFIHLFSCMYGLLLMLVVMTYSVWLFLAVLLGSGLGYFVFQPISQAVADRFTSRRVPRPSSSHQSNSQMIDSSINELIEVDIADDTNIVT